MGDCPECDAPPPSGTQCCPNGGATILTTTRTARVPLTEGALDG